MKKILALIALFALVCSLLAGCAGGNSGGNQDDGTDCVIPTTAFQFSMWDHFAKVKVLEVAEEFYSRFSPNDGNLLVARCEVIEDWIGGLESGRELYLVFSLSAKSDGWVTSEDFESIFASRDYFYAAFTVTEFPNYYAKDGTMITEKYGEVDFSDTIGIFNFNALPVKDGRLDLEAVDSLYLELNKVATEPISAIIYPDFDEYFRDGMTEEELKESVERIYGKEID